MADQGIGSPALKCVRKFEEDLEYLWAITVYPGIEAIFEGFGLRSTLLKDSKCLVGLLYILSSQC